MAKARSSARRELSWLDRTIPNSGEGAKCAPSEAAGREMPHHGPHDYAIAYQLGKHTQAVTITPHSNARS
jgi:hypothetical protein